MTVDRYELMVKEQNNKCKICGNEETRRSRTKGDLCRLVVDHCHSSDRIRGLLCHACNLMLGAAKDSIETLQAAIRYLKEK